VVVVLDGFLTLRTAYGTPRGDTRDACGDTDNGFAVLFNWNLLGDGPHTAVAFADGVEFGSATFHVTTLGLPFMRDVEGLYTIPDFPVEGETLGLQWEESAQNFRLVAPPGATAEPGPTPTPALPTPAPSSSPLDAEPLADDPVPPPLGMLENPSEGGHMSGVGIASGWVCDADVVDVVVDGAIHLAAAYPTERLDAAAACGGDTATGFAVLFNWGLLADGAHTAVAFADGIEFARATFQVTTLGAPFVRGLERTLLLEDFPTLGIDLEVRWLQSEQGFVISKVFGGATPSPAPTPTPSLTPDPRSITPTPTLASTPSPTPFVVPTPTSPFTPTPTSPFTPTPSPVPTQSPTPGPTPPVPAGCPNGAMPDGGNGLAGLLAVRLAENQRVVYCARLEAPARRVEFRVDSICGDAGGARVHLTVTPLDVAFDDGVPLPIVHNDNMPAKATYGSLGQTTRRVQSGTFLFDVLGLRPGGNCGGTNNLKISWVHTE
jgi:hypothetical protein